MLAALERRARPVLLPAGVLLGTLVVWEITWRLFNVPRFVVPLPSGILAETWQWRWYLLGHSGVTLYETLAGFGLSIAVGVPLAVIIVYSPVLRSAIYPLIVVTQAVPKVAIAPVLLLLLGAGAVLVNVLRRRRNAPEEPALGPEDKRLVERILGPADKRGDAK